MNVVSMRRNPLPPRPIASASEGCVRCPLCRQDWPGEPMRPRVSLDDNLFITEAGTVELTRIEAEIVFILVARMPQVVVFDSLVNGIWGCHEPADALSDLRVHIAHTRPKVATLGFTIENVRQHGYRLVPAATG